MKPVVVILTLYDMKQHLVVTCYHRETKYSYTFLVDKHESLCHNSFLYIDTHTHTHTHTGSCFS